jgi:hypothetical protein
MISKLCRDPVRSGSRKIAVHELNTGIRQFDEPPPTIELVVADGN